MRTYVDWAPISTYKGFPNTVMIAAKGITPVVASPMGSIFKWYLHPTGPKVDWFEPTHWALVPTGPEEFNEIEETDV